jgi:deazaflavin-dependent oxidoreductase (nitroreductase family)
VYVAVASRGGAPTHPVWYYNLKAEPKIELQDGEVTHEVVARELDGHERELWWARSVEAWPDYAEYQTKTDRILPVFLLEPVTN